MPEVLIAEPTGSPAALMTDDGECGRFSGIQRISRACLRLPNLGGFHDREANVFRS